MLKCFDISYNEISWKEARCVAFIIQKNPLLQVLNISNNSSMSSKDIKSRGVTTILQALQTVELPQMKSLNLSHTGNTNKATVNSLAKTLVRFNDLEKINISDVTVNINVILKCIEIMSSLRVLVLQNCGIDCNNAHLLSLIIAENANLHTLNVNNNNIMNTGFKIILNAFLGHQICHLKILQAANNITLDKPFIDITRTSALKFQLEYVDISNNNLKIAALFYLLAFVIDVRYLRTLKVCKLQDVQDEGNAAILNYLASFAKKLEYLDISGYRFSNDKLEEFLINIHLTHINISYCGITKGIAAHLVNDDVFNFDNLNSLDLSDSGPAVSIFCGFVKNIHTLKLQRCDISVNTLDVLMSPDSTICILHLCHNKLVDRKQKQSQLFDRLTQHLANPVSRSLKVLCLQSCELSNAEALAIFLTLKKNTVLKQLNLRNNCISYNPICCHIKDVMSENNYIEKICFVGNPMRPKETASVMLDCAWYSISVNIMEFPVTTLEQVKRYIRDNVMSINTWRVRHKNFTPLRLMFLHDRHFYGCT